MRSHENQDISRTAENSGSRRHFLASNAMGLGGIALSWLLQQDGVLAKEDRPETRQTAFDTLPKTPPDRKSVV